MSDYYIVIDSHKDVYIGRSKGDITEQHIPLMNARELWGLKTSVGGFLSPFLRGAIYNSAPYEFSMPIDMLHICGNYISFAISETIYNTIMDNRHANSEEMAELRKILDDK